MKKKFNFKAKLIGAMALAAGVCAVVPAALPQTAMAADAVSASASVPTGMYKIVRNINVYYINEDGTTTFGGSAPYTGYVSNKNMKFTFPEVKVADLFKDGLGYWKPDVETIPAVTATYDNPPAEVNIYLRKNEDNFVKESKVVKRTIKYMKLEPNGKISDAGGYEDSVTFYRTGYIDAKGNKVMSDWAGEYTFKDIEVPEIKDYTPDRAVIKGKTVTPSSADFTEEVVYTVNATMPTPLPPNPGPMPVPMPPQILEGWYRILTTKNMNFSLDVNGATSADLANIQIYKKNDSSAQKFYFKYRGAGFYSIYTASSNSNSALDITGNGKTAGTNIIQYRKHDGENQVWKVQKNDDGSVTFIAANSGLALDFVGARCQNFTNVALWTPNGSYAQKFTLVAL